MEASSNTICVKNWSLSVSLLGALHSVDEACGQVVRPLLRLPRVLEDVLPVREAAAFRVQTEDDPTWTNERNHIFIQSFQTKFWFAW